MYSGIESRNIQEKCIQKIHHIDIFSGFNCQINDFPCDSFVCCHLSQDSRHFHSNFLRIFHFFKVKFPIAPTCCTKLNGVLIEAIFLYLKHKLFWIKSPFLLSYRRNFRFISCFSRQIQSQVRLKTFIY